MTISNRIMLSLTVIIIVIVALMFLYAKMSTASYQTPIQTQSKPSAPNAPTTTTHTTTIDNVSITQQLNNQLNNTGIDIFGNSSWILWVGPAMVFFFWIIERLRHDF